MMAGLQFLKLPAVEVGAVLVAAAIVTVAVRSFRKNPAPEEVERERRLLVNLRGRIGDGVISDIQDDIIYFTYCVHGVDYQASQNVATLHELLPAEPHRIIGPVSLKYLLRNPANSIILCEKWSGLRQPPKS
jgi:hypothetical protein